MGLKKERAEAAIEELFETQLSLKDLLAKHGVAPGNFFKLLSQVPLLDTAYKHAQAGRIELLVDEIISIADNESDPQKARNMIDVRKWMASKIAPHKYGERLEVNLNANVDIRGALLEASNRIRSVIELSATGSQPVAEIAEFKTDLDKLLE
jgi:hypothetical protein